MKAFYFVFNLLAFGLIFTSVGMSQEAGYEITLTVKEYEKDSVFLAYRRADKIYSRDTAILENGKFVFKGEEALPTGIYLCLMRPDNKFFEFLVTENEQKFSIETKAPNYHDHLKFENAPDNVLLNKYQIYMSEKIKEAQTYQGQMESAATEELKGKFEKQLERLQEQLRVHQTALREQNPNTFTAKLIGAFMEPKVPDAPVRPDGSIDETFQFRYFRSHYFDHFDFAEAGFVNSPYLKQKIDYYIDKLTVQSPDSLKIAVDYLIDKASANRSVFRYTLPYLLNRYYRPKIVGLDEIYVHITDKYYRTGIADWTDEETLKKITDDAYMISQVLIGKQAPEVSCNLFDYETESWTDELVSLYDIEADYTIVFLWKPGCPACKKMTADLKEFYNEWKNKGVEIYAISSASKRDLEKATKDIKEKDVSWITVADPYLKARALMKFYGTSLPKVYLLDKNKKILASRIGTEQLVEIIKKEEKKK